MESFNTVARQAEQMLGEVEALADFPAAVQRRLVQVRDLSSQTNSAPRLFSASSKRAKKPEKKSRQSLDLKIPKF